jgi:hypothetical protein
MMIGQRKNEGCRHSDDGLGCAADALVITGVAIDGVMQLAGASLILAGYLTTRSELVRNEYGAPSGRVRLLPVAVGRGGYGIGIGAAF